MKSAHISKVCNKRKPITQAIITSMSSLAMFTLTHIGLLVALGSGGLNYTAEKF